MMKGNAVRLAAVLWMTGLLSGCSVIMASSGNEEPNFGVIQPGATRTMVEGELGPPYHTVNSGNERTDWYEYELGNAPNGDRALANFALDVYSFLLWEFIATPRELMMGDDYKMSVIYGPDDRVVAVNRSDPKVDEVDDEAKSPQTGNGKKEPESTGSQEPSATTPEENPFTGSVQGDRPPSPPQN